MIRTHSGVLAVVAVLVLAGATPGVSGAPVRDDRPGDGPVRGHDRPGDGPATAGSPATLADAQANGTTDEDGETTADDLPPGVSESGVEDVDALVAAHRQALADSGYRFVLETNLSSGFAGGVEQWVVRNGTVAAGLSPFRFRTVSRLVFANETASPRPTETDAWGNDTAVVVRTRTGEVTRVQRVSRGVGGDIRFEAGTGPEDDRRVALPDLLTAATVVETVLRSGEFEVVDVRRGADATLVTLRATAVDPDAVDDAAAVTTFEAELVVDGDGAVRRLEYEFATGPGDGPDVRYRYRADPGAVAVAEPAWVAGAVASDAANVSTGVVVATAPPPGRPTDPDAAGRKGNG